MIYDILLIQVLFFFSQSFEVEEDHRVYEMVYVSESCKLVQNYELCIFFPLIEG